MNARELLIDTTPHVPPARALEALERGDAERRLSDGTHSVAEIVAHLAFWQDWFRRRCQGVREPMPARAALGWPMVGPGSWPEVRDRFLTGLEEMTALTADHSRRDVVVTPALELPSLAGYTVGDVLVHVAAHNAYHLGQVVLLRQSMGLWPPPSGGWTW